MNKTKIEWCDYTWNPITGCLGGCNYCYAKRISQRFNKTFKIEYHPERLNQPLSLKKPSKIFVCSMSDFWGIGVEQEWRETIITKVFRYCPQHTFLILTKQPQNIMSWELERFEGNVWVGITITGDNDLNKTMYFDKFPHYKNILKFVSFEPLVNDVDVCNLKKVDWLIIGAMTGKGLNCDYKYPRETWIRNILNKADEYKIPVFMKNNLKPYWDNKIRQEFPLTAPTGQRR